MFGHLRDALFVTLDDVQLRVADGLEGALDHLERLADAARAALQLLQDSQVGRAASSGLDDALSRLEDATAYYLPLPATLREYRGIVGNCCQTVKLLSFSVGSAVWSDTRVSHDMNLGADSPTACSPAVGRLSGL